MYAKGDMKMDKRTKEKLETTIRYCESILAGKPFHATAAQLDCIPSYLNAMTPTAAKKQGLVLKRGAKPIASMEWKIPAGGYGHGQLYIGSRFKVKAKSN